MFDRLVEMVTLISKNKLHRIEIVGENANTDSKLYQLYEGIDNGSFKDDTAAANALYGKAHNDSNYRNTKYQLEKRLINTLFHIDVNHAQYNDSQTAYYNCYKNLAAVAILSGQSAKISAISIARRTLKIAQDYEFTDIALAIIHKLLGYFCFNQKDYELYLALREQETNLFDIYTAEILATRYRQNIYACHRNKPNMHEEHLAMVKTAAMKIKPLMEKHKSYRFCMKAYDILCIRYEIVHDYPKVIEICNQAIDFFQQKEYANYKITLFLFLCKNIVYYTALDKYEAAEATAIKGLASVEQGGRNWFIVLEHYMILCFQRHDYVKAYELWLTGVQSKLYKSLLLRQKLRWDIYEAYSMYFIKYHGLELDVRHRPKFSFHRFLNQIPKKDKNYRHNHIAILALQILAFFEKKKYKKALACIKALKAYANRVLNQAYTARSSYFIRMLKILEQSQLNPTAARRKVAAAAYLEKMAEYPVDVGQELPKVEVLPYEYMWELMLEHLPVSLYFDPN